MFYKYKKYFMALGIIILCVIALIVITFFNKTMFKAPALPEIKVQQTKTTSVNTNTNTNTKPVESSIKSNNTLTNTANNNMQNQSNLVAVNNSNSNSTSSNIVPYSNKNIVKEDNININYNKNLTIKSNKKELEYKIINAKMISKNKISFDVKIIKNNGIGSLNVIALDNFGNSLIVTPSNQSEGDSIEYIATIENPNTKCIEISVQNEFNISDQQTTQITINFAKKETMDALYMNTNDSNKKESK